MNWRRHLFGLWNLWLPFFGAGIRIREVSRDWRRIVVDLKKRPWTLNYVGTQYGGSIYSMTDPFFVVMLIQCLGPDYVVWDRSANIRFLKPGRTRLTVEFELTDGDLDQIRSAVDQNGKTDWPKTLQVRDREGTVVAEVDKVIYVRRKRPDSRRSPE